MRHRSRQHQIEVGEVGGWVRGRKDLHGSLQFRIGHQRQVNQALDRVSLQIAPERLVFGLNLFPSRMRRDVNAEQTQAGERAGHGLGVFPVHDMQLDLETIERPPGRPSTPAL